MEKERAGPVTLLFLCRYGNLETLTKKLLSEVETEIKNMKVRFASGKINDDIYSIAIREMQNRKDVLTLELEKCNENLSNLDAQIPVIIATACN